MAINHYAMGSDQFHRHQRELYERDRSRAMQEHMMMQQYNYYNERVMSSIQLSPETKKETTEPKPNKLLLLTGRK